MKIHNRLALMAGALATFLLPTMASAYEVMHNHGCDKVRWLSNPTYRIITNSFDTAAKRDAITEPGNAIGSVGGQYYQPAFSTITNPSGKKYGNQHNDFYFAALADYGMGDYAGWTRRKVRLTTCYMKEVDILFDSADNFTYGIPADNGLNYWSTGYTEGPGGSKHFRMVSLHEQLHAAGLKHEDNVFAVMNYNSYPWRNDNRILTMSPLPDDRRGLRKIYGDSGGESNIAALTTYIDFTDLSENGVPRIQELCRASKGSQYSASIFDPHCGIPQVFTGCPGDTVYARFTMANDGTSSATVTKKLYFSTDPVLSWNDEPSYVTSNRTLDAGMVYRDRSTFTVPQALFPGNSYYMILKLESDLPFDESPSDNWIPLNNTKLTIANNCP